MNNNADGNLTHGWMTLSAHNASGGVLACPSVIYVPSDGCAAAPILPTLPLLCAAGPLVGTPLRSCSPLPCRYYYTVSGGSAIPLQRSRDLLRWQKAPQTFIRPSSEDVLTASGVMASARDNLRRCVLQCYSVIV